MPPMYDWRHIPTNTMHEVRRDVEDIEILPTKEETGSLDDSERSSWQREIGNITVTYKQGKLKGGGQ